jgi:hypothetical protein
MNFGVNMFVSEIILPSSKPFIRNSTIQACVFSRKYSLRFQVSTAVSMKMAALSSFLIDVVSARAPSLRKQIMLQRDSHSVR